MKRQLSLLSLLSVGVAALPPRREPLSDRKTTSQPDNSRTTHAMKLMRTVATGAELFSQSLTAINSNAYRMSSVATQISLPRVAVLATALVFGAISERAQAQCSGSACVDSADIVNGSVRTPDLASDAVTRGKIAVGAVGRRALAPASVNQEELANNAVARGKIAVGAVGSEQIAEGAIRQRTLAAGVITGDKVMGNTLNEQHFSVANRIVVAKNGGDFTTIGEALAAISSGNPTVIDVMPGLYIENVTMKSSVHLRGAGHLETVIGHDSACGTCNVITLTDVAGAEISGLRVFGAPAGASGIHVEGGVDIIIRDNTVVGNGAGDAGEGRGINIQNVSAGGLRIKVLDNFIIGNGCTGIRTEGSFPEILRNSFRGQDERCSTPRDIDVVSGAANISFNVLEFITGVDGNGNYNVTPDGDAVDVP